MHVIYELKEVHYSLEEAQNTNRVRAWRVKRVMEHFFCPAISDSLGKLDFTSSEDEKAEIST